MIIRFMLRLIIFPNILEERQLKAGSKKTLFFHNPLKLFAKALGDEAFTKGFKSSYDKDNINHPSGFKAWKEYQVYSNYNE